MSGTVSPKRKIVVSNQSMEHEDDEDEPEVEGTGLTLFAVAIGTSSLLLCGFSIIWMFVSKWWEHLEQWPIILMVFLASFLMGLMGLVIAHLSRLVVKLAYRLSRMDTD